MRIGFAKRNKCNLVILCSDFLLSHFEIGIGAVEVVINIHKLTLPCITWRKITDILKVVDVPAYLVDMLFEIIEQAVSLFVFFAINVVNNIIGKPLDVANVIC